MEYALYRRNVFGIECHVIGRKSVSFVDSIYMSNNADYLKVDRELCV